MTDKMNKAVMQLFKFWCLQATPLEMMDPDAVDNAYQDIAIVTGLTKKEVKEIILSAASID